MAGALSGIALGISIHPSESIPFGLISWIALVPFLLGARTASTLREYLWMAIPLGFNWAALAVWWVLLPYPSAILPVLISYALLLSAHCALPVLLIRGLGWRAGTALFPVAWTAWEWVNMHLPFSTGWLALAHSHASFPALTQIADLGGLWGVSFWICLMNAGAALIIDAVPRKNRTAIPAGGALLGIALFWGLMIAASWAYSYGKLAEPPDNRDRIAVSIIQPNTEPGDRWNRELWGDQLLQLIEMSEAAVAEAGPELLVWPEMAIPWFLLDDVDTLHRSGLRDLVRRWQTSLVFGFPDMQDSSALFDRPESDTTRHMPAYNAAALLTAQGTIEVHHKNRLLPYVEAMPFQERLPFLRSLQIVIGSRSSWERGTTPGVLAFTARGGADVRLGVGICYEQLYPEYSAHQVQKGADLLLFITNDGWFGRTPALQQAASIARFRCIENRRWMVRCANNGVSQIIDDCGRVTAVAPSWEPFVLTAYAGLRDSETLYTRAPDVLPMTCAGLSAVLLAVSMFGRRRRRAV